MARTVALSPHTGEAIWLIQGRAVLSQAANNAADAPDQPLVNVELSPRVAASFARLVRFIEMHYPDYANGTHLNQAGSAAVQELAKIHAISPATAQDIAPRCFCGQMTVNDLRGQLATLYEQAAASKQAIRKVGSRRFAEFFALAMHRIKNESVLPFDNRIAEFMMNERGQVLEPTLVAREIISDREIAIEIRAPKDTAARSVANVAAELVARVSVLRLHYADAILVLPAEATEIAQAASDLWRTWLKFSPQQWCKMDILLLDEHSHRVISTQPAQAVELP
ncbi:MAG: hypothetical protein IPG93_10185 [Burkholderiales bacterium]|nr:hypothetical protein [Burkholderiales bacterium]